MSDVEVLIEIPYNTNVKYETDDQGRIYVDRVLSTSMVYPGNYGFIENTLAGDGDPIDALIINHTPFAPCSRVRCRIIGVLETRDENGLDEKLICVPIDKIDKKFSKYQDIDDINNHPHISGVKIAVDEFLGVPDMIFEDWSWFKILK